MTILYMYYLALAMYHASQCFCACVGACTWDSTHILKVLYLFT